MAERAKATFFTIETCKECPFKCKKQLNTIFTTYEFSCPRYERYKVEQKDKVKKEKQKEAKLNADNEVATKSRTTRRKK